MMSLNDSSEKQPRNAVKSRNENNKGNSVRTRAMKTFQIILVVAVLSRPALLTAAEPAAGNADESKAATNLTEQTNQLQHHKRRHPLPHRKRQSRECLRNNGTNLLRMNFRGASFTCFFFVIFFFFIFFLFFIFVECGIRS